jgi:hypothetical protein
MKVKKKGDFTMKIIRLFAVLLLVSFTFAQTSPTESQSDKEKKQKELEKQVLQMLDQAVGDAGTLKLARNRAIVFGVAGDLFWKFDEKRSRQLFRDMANDIIVSNQEAEKEKKDRDDPGMFYEMDFENLRSDLLPFVAKHDADMALEMLVQTRPAKVTEAMAKAAQPKQKEESGMFNFDRNAFSVRQELALEQQFAVLAAEQNPDKAIKLLQDSLAKGISYNVFGLLDKINKKSADKAKSLADEIVKKIVDTDLAKKREEMAVAIQFLQIASKPESAASTKAKRYKFTDSQMKDIANKLFTTFMTATASMETTMMFTQAQPILEKALPEKAILLKQRKTELSKNLPPEMKQFEQISKVYNPNSTADELLAEIPKLNEGMREQAYEVLGQKIAKIEDEAKAKKMIEQIPDEKARERANEKYESAKISRAASSGKLEDAKKLIGNLGVKKNQIKKLVALALEFKKKNTEKDTESAVNLMKDAKALINEFPEDEDELNDLMEVVKGYASVNPNEAFRLFDPIVDQINDYVQASAILSKYNKNGNRFKKGELLFSTNKGYWGEGMLIFRYIEQMQMLGKADLNRMTSLSDKFQRNDSRTIVKLFVAQGFLKDEKEDDDKKLGDDDNEIMFGF